jgi:hypothetical protein
MKTTGFALWVNLGTYGWDDSICANIFVVPKPIPLFCSDYTSVNTDIYLILEYIIPTYR